MSLSARSVLERLRTGDVRARVAALQDVARIEATPEVVAEVVALLSHGEGRVRRLALEVLALGADGGALSVDGNLWRRALELRRDPDAAVRAEVAVALATLPGVDLDEAAVVLLAMLRDEAPQVRREAAAALGDLRLERARSTLVERLSLDLDADTRFELAFALATLRDEAALEPMVAALGTARFTDACEGLKRLGDARAIEPIRGHALRFFLGWPERIVAHATLYALGAHEEATRYLLGKLDVWNRGERELAIATLGHLQVAAARPRLERIAADKKDRARGVAITALGHLGDEASRPLLAQLTEDLAVAEDVAHALALLAARRSPRP